jgi:serine O-acetyltransferase
MKSVLWTIAHKSYESGFRRFARGVELLYFIINGNSISAQAKIGGGTVFFHHGVGCVVHSRSIIGEDCRIFQNVTIGSKWSDDKDPGKPPTIGNHVQIGAGAVLLGDIRIGDYAKIGANAVVLQDVPVHSVAVGVPAKIIKSE